MPRSFLTDEMWARLEPLLPPERGGMGRSRLPNRPMVEAILWRHRTGAPWRDLPEEYGPWTSVYTRFDAWTRRGVWQDVLEWLRRDADVEWVKARHAIENGFARLKQFRSLATRFDKTARSFSAQVALACIVLWLRL